VCARSRVVSGSAAGSRIRHSVGLLHCLQTSPHNTYTVPLTPMGGPTTRMHTMSPVAGAKRASRFEPLFSDEEGSSGDPEESGSGAHGNRGGESDDEHNGGATACPSFAPAAKRPKVRHGPNSKTMVASSQVGAVLASTGVSTIFPLVVSFAEGLMPLIGKCAQGMPVAPYMCPPSKQPSAFELHLLLLDRPGFMPMLPNNANSVAGCCMPQWLWREVLKDSANASRRWKRPSGRPLIDVEQERGARAMLLDQLFDGPAWVSHVFSAWALLQTHTTRRSEDNQPATATAVAGPGALPNAAPRADANAAPTTGATTGAGIGQLIHAAAAPVVPVPNPTTGMAVEATIYSTAPDAAVERAQSAFLDRGAIEAHLATLRDGRDPCLANNGAGPTGLRRRSGARDREAEAFYRLLLEWRYRGFRACLASHEQHAISPRDLFAGAGERRLLIGELKRRGVSASIKTIALKNAPPQCLDRLSHYPYAGQATPGSKEALKQKYPLLTVSWVAGLDAG
jgi:hypothetical protein